MTPNNTQAYKTITVRREGRHVLVNLARPHKSNSLDDDMWREIPQVPSAFVSYLLAQTHRFQLLLTMQVFEALDAMDDVYAVCILF